MANHLLSRYIYLFQDELAPVIVGADRRAVLDYYFANDLLAPRKSCPTCFADMKLVSRSQLSDRFAWHCKNFQCGSRSYHSVRADSFFARSRVPLQKYIHMVYLWAQNSPVKTAAETLGVSRQCVQQHFLFLREVCSAHLINDPVVLGGANVIVQIDESLFRHKPKYHRGRVPASDQWVFGLCDTWSRLHGARTRPSMTLLPIIERVVLPGSIIHSDQWAAYRQLSRNNNYTYATVNHNENFVDPATGVHTQAIESYWAKVKLKFKAMKGVSSEQLPSYLDERMWRDRFGADITAAFHNICAHISLIYWF